MSFFALFWFFSSKTRQSHAHCIFFEKHRHESVVFLMKNVQNQKYNIISTSFFVTFYGTFRWLNAPNSLRTETRKKNNEKFRGDPFLATEKLLVFSKTIPLWCPFDFFLTGMRAMCFWQKISKIKKKLFYRRLFLPFLWFFPPKT